jgi:hypothetical protein
MSDFEVDHGRVVAFDFGGEYVFSHYFEREDVFRDLREYYLDDEYRFEVPAEDIEAVREVLAEAHYRLDVVEDPEPYCVAVEQYTEHADILRESVAHWTRRGYEFFLMPEEPAVKEALEQGATPVEDIDLAAGI